MNTIGLLFIASWQQSVWGARSVHTTVKTRVSVCKRKCWRKGLVDRKHGEMSMSWNSQDHVAATHRFSKKYPVHRTEPVGLLSARHFINLTNGVETLTDMRRLLTDQRELRFTRIQSSHCESGAYNKILSSLDNELLFCLACGRNCYVYDLASRNKTRGVPRALFLGIEFVKWSLAYLWFGAERPHLVPDRVLVRGKNTVPFWKNEVLPYKITKETKKKIRYFSPFVREMGINQVQLHGIYGKCSAIDGCKGVHAKLVREWLEETDRSTVEDAPLHHWLERNGYALYDSEADYQELVETQQSMSTATKACTPQHVNKADSAAE